MSYKSVQDALNAIKGAYIQEAINGEMAADDCRIYNHAVEWLIGIGMNVDQISDALIPMMAGVFVVNDDDALH